MSIYTLNTFSFIWVQWMNLSSQDIGPWGLLCYARWGFYLSRIAHLFAAHNVMPSQATRVKWADFSSLSEPQHVGYINEWAMTCHISSLGRMALLGAAWEANKPSGNKAYVPETEMEWEERKGEWRVLFTFSSSPFSFSTWFLFAGTRQIPFCHKETHCMLYKEIRIRWSHKKA